MGTFACTCMTCVMLLHEAIFKRVLNLMRAMISTTLRFYSCGSCKAYCNPQQACTAVNTDRSAYPGVLSPNTVALNTPNNIPTPAQTAALIRNRRSIYPKHMTGNTVSKESIMAMLEAANWAPTHGRTEPWRFVVLGKQGMQDMQLLTADIYGSQLADRPRLLQV